MFSVWLAAAGSRPVGCNLRHGSRVSTVRMDHEVQQLLERRRYDEALERLLDRHEQQVFRMAVMMLRDAGRAEEVTQDIFLKLWRALPDYDGRASVSTWLYTIARNSCLSAVRAEAYRRTRPLDDAPEPAAPATNREPALDAALAKGLEALPEIQREVITLFYLQERSVRDVAAQLDLPEGTVKSHLHRARRALGAMLE
jgi:RNA polymerase sigma-70 factor (ECF subfamily)